MTKEIQNQNVIIGDIDKFISIGTVVGQVLVADKNSVNDLQFHTKRIGPRKDGFRTQYLDLCQKFWVDNLLTKSLERGDIGVNVAPAPNNLYFFTKPSDNNLNLPARDLLDLFDSNNGDMLILGSPGSGKTTLMLQLVQILIKRALVDETQKMPFVINLTEWSSFTTTDSANVDTNPSNDTLLRLREEDRYRLTLGRFVHKVLTEQYKIPAEIANNWMQNNTIAIFLDGFDEILENIRTVCIKELNIYRNSHPNIPLVVCSRITEYEQLAEKLHLEIVLAISNLKPAQAQKYLQQLGLAQLVKLYETEQATSELCKSPFWLNLLIQAYNSRSWDSFFVPKDIKNRSYDLIESYLSIKGGYSLESASINQRDRVQKLAKLMAANGVSMLRLESLRETKGWGTLSKAFDETHKGIGDTAKFVARPVITLGYTQIQNAVKNSRLEIMLTGAIIAGVLYVASVGKNFISNEMEKKNKEKEYQQILMEKELAQKAYEDSMKSYIEIAEQMVSLGLMRKVGENYIWVHEIIKQHIADRDEYLHKNG